MQPKEIKCAGRTPWPLMRRLTLRSTGRCAIEPRSAGDLHVRLHENQRCCNYCRESYRCVCCGDVCHGSRCRQIRMEFVLSVGHRTVYSPSRSLRSSIESNGRKNICRLPNRGGGLAIHLLVLHRRDVVFGFLNFGNDLHIRPNVSPCWWPDCVGYCMVPVCKEAPN